MVEIEIKEERENELMNRRELKVVIPHSGAPTPSRAMIQSVVAEKQSIDPRNVVVDKILSGVGRAKCTAFVDIYEEAVTEDLAGEAEEETEEQEEDDSEGKEGQEETESEDADDSGEQDDSEEDEEDKEGE